METAPPPPAQQFAPSPPPALEQGPTKKLPLAKRARSVPYKKPFIWSLVSAAMFYLALVGTFAAMFAFMAIPGKSTAAILIGFVGFSAILWINSFFRRRNCHCPLCKGTPFLDSGAHRHVKAIRFFPLNYGSTNVIRALVRQHFRCQYCGTPFDLLKPIAKHPDQGKK